MSAPSLSDGVHSAAASLESATKAFLTKQRKKRLRKAHDDVLPIDEERSLAKRERMANHAAQHGSHILKSLTMKRKALDLAVVALGTCTDACLGAMGSHFSASSSAAAMTEEDDGEGGGPNDSSEFSPIFLQWIEVGRSIIDR